MWLNILFFNSVWFGLVLLGDSFVIFAILALAVHLFYCQKTLAELRLILTITFIGTMLDSYLAYIGVFHFELSAIYVLPIPLWLIVLWASFAATIAHSMQFLQKSPWLQFIVGGIFPPLSYIAGASFSAVNFSHPTALVFLWLSMIWAPLMVFCFYLQARFYRQGVTDA